MFFKIIPSGYNVIEGYDIVDIVNSSCAAKMSTITCINSF